MMLDTHRLAMLAGQWFPIRPKSERNFRVRRLVAGNFETHAYGFVTEEKAQQLADRLNELEVCK